ncbi:Pkinase-domain-containing protein, partial [Ramicandelaber brevisporus]
LELGLEFCVDLRAEDLTELDELGSGNGGVVVKALHIPTNIIMAKKSIKLDIKPESRKRIIRELQFLHECNSPHVVSFYGAFLSGRGDVCMCMEFMDVGSFDDIYRKNGPIPIDIIGKALVAVLNGLIYIYETHRIIHRDIKPSNILLNSQGQVKLIDFGVSGELVDSIAKTFVGTGSYMSPERIQGAPYSVKSDVWSLGITLMELALGRYPLSPDGN